MAWIFPVVGDWVYSWFFGDPYERPDGTTAYHQGLDIATSGITGLPVVAPVPMEIVYTGYDEEGYGNYVKGVTDDGLEVILAHFLNPAMVKAGDMVDAGEQVGEVGSTGNSSGPHLHLEIRRGGMAIDPYPFVEGAVTPDPDGDYKQGTPGYQPGNVSSPIVNLNDAFKGIGDFLGFIADVNYSKLFVNIGVVILGLLLLGLGIYMFTQTEALKMAGSAIGEQLAKANKEGSKDDSNS